MIKCAHCGSSAQLKPIHTQWEEDGWSVDKITIYQCGCGHHTQTRTHYESTTYEYPEKEFFLNIFDNPLDK